jgi:hypothetical protein
MYFAYYRVRIDGDGDLCAIVESGESIPEEVAESLRDSIEKSLQESGEKWFRRESPDCDFPDVWDLTREMAEWHRLQHRSGMVLEELYRKMKPGLLEPL